MSQRTERRLRSEFAIEYCSSNSIDTRNIGRLLDNLHKVITTMEIRQLDDSTYFARSLVVNLRFRLNVRVLKWAPMTDFTYLQPFG